MYLRINQIRPRRESTTFPQFLLIRTIVESGIESSGRQSVVWQSAGADDQAALSFLQRGAVLVVPCTNFCLLVPCSYPFKPTLFPTQIIVMCTIGMQLMFLLFSQLLSAFYFHLDTSYYPRFSCPVLSKLTFQKQHTFKNYKKEYILCSLQYTLKIVKYNEFSY